MKTNIVLAFLTFALAGSVSAMPSVFAGFTPDGSGGTHEFTQSNTVGWQFTVTAANGIDVRALGMYEYSTEGYGFWLGPAVISIWDPAAPAAPVANVSFYDSERTSSLGAWEGPVQFKDLSSPVHLNAGSRYIIGGYISGDPYNWSLYGVSGSFGDGISYEGSRIGAGGMPTGEAGRPTQSYLGPDFLYTETGASGTPEPSTFALLGAGVLLLAFRKRSCS